MALSLVLASCAGAQAGAGAADSTSAGAGWIAAGFEVNSWGRPLTIWSLHPDGTGTWRKDAPFSNLQDEAKGETHALAASPDQMARLHRILAKLPQTLPGPERCRDRITDMPYGKLTLSSAGQGGEKVYAFDTGCQDRSYRQYIAMLGEADALVGAWGEASPSVNPASK